MRKLLTIFENPRWRPPPSWILENLHIWPKGSILAGTRCLLLNFGENCFIHAEIINNFRNPRWRLPPSWIFKIFFFLVNRRVYIILLRIAMNFGEDWSTQSKVASIFRNFWFGLNFPFEGLFGAVFGGRRPPKVILYNSNPQKAQLAAERRHMAHWSWKSADPGGRWACRWRNRQKKGHTFPVIFHPFPGGKPKWSNWWKFAGGVVSMT